MNEFPPSGSPGIEAAPPSIAGDLQSLRPALMHFAMRHLRDRALAEDAVHDAMLAVLEQPQRFARRATLLTYVTSILRFKIIDSIREIKRGHNTYTEVDGDAELGDQCSDETRVAASAQAHYEQNDFLRLVDRGLSTLPQRSAHAFTLRYGLELSNDEICREMHISAANLWTMLHRARSRLRAFVGPVWLGLAVPAGHD